MSVGRTADSVIEDSREFSRAVVPYPHVSLGQYEPDTSSSLRSIPTPQEQYEPDTSSSLRSIPTPQEQALAWVCSKEPVRETLAPTDGLRHEARSVERAPDHTTPAKARRAHLSSPTPPKRNKAATTSAKKLAKKKKGGH